MARPQEFKNRKSITGLVEKDEFDQLEEIRWREKKGQGEIIRMAIQEYIRNHAEGNDTFKIDDWQTDPNFKAIPTLLAPDEKWVLCFQNSTNEELSQMYVALKKRRKQLVTEEIKRANEEGRSSRWGYEKFDIPTYNAVPMLKGDS